MIASDHEQAARNFPGVAFSLATFSWSKQEKVARRETASKQVFSIGTKTKFKGRNPRFKMESPC